MASVTKKINVIFIFNDYKEIENILSIRLSLTS